MLKLVPFLKSCPSLASSLSLFSSSLPFINFPGSLPLKKSLNASLALKVCFLDSFLNQVRVSSVLFSKKPAFISKRDDKVIAARGGHTKYSLDPRSTSSLGSVRADEVSFERAKEANFTPKTLAPLHPSFRHLFLWRRFSYYHPVNTTATPSVLVTASGQTLHSNRLLFIK